MRSRMSSGLIVISAVLGACEDGRDAPATSVERLETRPDAGERVNVPSSGETEGIMSSCGDMASVTAQAISALSSDLESVTEVRVVGVADRMIERVVTSSEGVLMTRGWNVTFQPITSFRGASDTRAVQSFVLDRSLGEVFVDLNGRRWTTRDHATVHRSTRRRLGEMEHSGQHQLIVLRRSSAGLLAPFIAAVESSGVQLDDGRVRVEDLLRRADEARRARPSLPRRVVTQEVIESRREVDPT